MSANEVETKEKQKLPEIKKLTATYIYEGISFVYRLTLITC